VHRYAQFIQDRASKAPEDSVSRLLSHGYNKYKYVSPAFLVRNGIVPDAGQKTPVRRAKGGELISSVSLRPHAPEPSRAEQSARKESMSERRDKLNVTDFDQSIDTTSPLARSIIRKELASRRNTDTLSQLTTSLMSKSAKYSSQEKAKRVLFSNVTKQSRGTIIESSTKKKEH
jgi:hypothetical protein